MSVPQKFLVATVFTAVSDEAVVTGLSIARWLGARVHLLHVCEPLERSEDLMFEAPAVDQQEREAMRTWSATPCARNDFCIFKHGGGRAWPTSKGSWSRPTSQKQRGWR